MEKITLNGKRYIALGDFDHLRHNLCKDIYDSYRPAGDGKIHLSETDRGRIDAYNRIMREVMYEEIHSAESPDDIREMHDGLRKEWMRDKYVIVGNDNGKNVFFRKMCAMGEDGAERPAFCSKIRLAKTFSDHYDATIYAQYLMQNWDIETMVEPLYLFAMTNADAKKLLDALCKKDEPEYNGDGTRAEDEGWDEE